MICRIIQWFISQSLDTNSELPPFAGRHIEGCPSCRRFMVVSKQLGEKLERDAWKLDSRPVFAAEGRVRPAYSLRLAALTACVLIVSGFIVLNQVRNVQVYEASAMESILPQDAIMGILAKSGVPDEFLANGLDGYLSKEIDYLAQDVRSAAEYIAGTLPPGVLEFN